MATQSSHKYSLSNKPDKSKKTIKSKKKQNTNSNEQIKSNKKQIESGQSKDIKSKDILDESTKNIKTKKKQHINSNEQIKSNKKQIESAQSKDTKSKEILDEFKKTIKTKKRQDIDSDKATESSTIKNQIKPDQSNDSKSKEILDESAVDVNDVDNNFNRDTSFILKRNKKSGNFSILRKITKTITKNKNSENEEDDNNNDKIKKMCGVQRVKYTVYRAYLPFGREEYNNNLILNAVINDSTNLNHNLIVTLKQIIKAFENLRDTEQGRYKYAVNDKKFFSFMKELKNEDESNESESNDENEKKIKKYKLRLYLRYGAKVIHAKHVGELNYNQLKGKYCNLDLELGSLWGELDMTIEGHSADIFCLKILSNGRVVTASADRTLKIWNVQDGTCENTLFDYDNKFCVSRCIVTFSGKIICCSYGDEINLVKVWNMDNYECENSILYEICSDVSCVDVLPDGRVITGDSEIKIWDSIFHNKVSNNQIKYDIILKEHTDSVQCITVFPNTSQYQFVSGSSDKTIKIWSIQKQETSINNSKCLNIDIKVKTLVGHTDIVCCVKILPDGRIASGSADQTIKIWDQISDQCLMTLVGHTDIVCSIAVLPDCDFYRIVSGSWDKTIKIWNPKTGNCLMTLNGHTDYIYCVDVLPDGRIISTSADKTIKIWY